MAIIKRTVKGSALTHEELDGNFDHLDTNKVEKEVGKQLSTENYTTAEKSKVANTPSDTNAALDLKANDADVIKTETDPTVPAHVKSISTTDIDNWNNTASSSGATIPEWTATAYTAGNTVSYQGSIWKAKVNTLSTDIPSSGTKWKPVTANVSGEVLQLEFEEVNLIYTWKNYILEYVSDANNDIRFSKDSGKTWTTWVNPHGEIAKVHIFTEGTIMFCTPTQVFTTKDFVTVTESTVLDHDGTPFVGDSFNFFTITKQNNEIKIIDGVEMEVWSDYMITNATGASTYVSRFWYTTDLGQTLKCAIKFGTTLLSGEDSDCRHSHGTYYNKVENKFITTTGDGDRTSKVIESIYTPHTDEWVHKIMISGNAYKFAGVFFDEHYTYFITDYTLDTPLRGILKCKSDSLDDSAAYEHIYKSDNEVKPLIDYYEDTNGNRILTGDDQALGEFYYAKGDFNFKKVTHNFNRTIARMTSVNYNGDMYAILFPENYEDFSTVRQKYVNLTKAFRNAGIYDFNQEKVILGNNKSFTNPSIVEPKNLTGEVIKLHPEGNNYNYTTPSSATTYQLDSTVVPEMNDFARCFINTATKPSVTGATEISGGADWVADTNMEMVIECPIKGSYEYYFLTR